LSRSSSPGQAASKACFAAISAATSFLPKR
jgi:hypothetical protein